MSELNGHFQMNEDKWPTITCLKFSSSLVIREKKREHLGLGNSFLGKELASQVVDLSLTPTTQTQDKMCTREHACKRVLRDKRMPVDW